MKRVPLLLVALFSPIVATPQDPVGQCRGCHAQGGHANAGEAKCPVCGAVGPVCCAKPHCFEGKCRDCGKEVKSEIGKLIDQLSDAAKRDEAARKLEKSGRKAVARLKQALGKAEGDAKSAIEKLLELVDWPEGGKLVEGLQMSLKPSRDRFKVGEIVELKLRIANTTDREWSRDVGPHYSGFEAHLWWTATRGDRVPDMPVSAACCPASHFGGPEKLTLKLGAGESKFFTIRAALPPIKTRDGKLMSGAVSRGGAMQISKLAEEEGTWLVRFSDSLVGLQSPETKVVVER